MKPNLEQSIQILQNTPQVLKTLFNGLCEDMIRTNEGAGTWSAFDVVGHLIVCEQTNFMQRIIVILSDEPVKVFHPVDMSAQFGAGKGKSITDLLTEFRRLRAGNIQRLMNLNPSPADFVKEASHSVLGNVTLGNVLSTWVAHDLMHTAQITRVLAKQYKESIGPFVQYLTRL